MTRPTPAAKAEEKAKMVELMTKSNEQEQIMAPSEVDTSPCKKVVIVKIPSRFMEDKVKILMASAESQFEETGYKVVFMPEEVDVFILGQKPLEKGRWTGR
jgi:hypothetical protein